MAPDADGDAAPDAEGAAESDTEGAAVPVFEEHAVNERISISASNSEVIFFICVFSLIIIYRKTNQSNIGMHVLTTSPFLLFVYVIFTSMPYAVRKLLSVTTSSTLPTIKLLFRLSRAASVAQRKA